MSKKFDNNRYNNQLAAIQFQLRSKRSGEIRIALKQVQEWLVENPENPKIYKLLSEVTIEQPDLIEDVNTLLEFMSQKGSKSAVETIKLLPVTTKDLVNRADEAYYLGDFDKASRIYQTVLEKEPGNEYSKDQMIKVELARAPVKPDKTIPPEAAMWYRQARSYLAAKDYQTAKTFLKAAIEGASVKNVDFSDARELLKEIENLLSPKDTHLKIFISYSHQDEKHKDKLVKMLTPLQDQGVLEIWQDREIEPGDEWYKSIQNAMNACDLALLLISDDFLASRFIRDEELYRLLQRRKEEGLRVVQIIVSECLWKKVPVLKDIQALPKDGRPVVSFAGAGQRDRVWTEIAQAIENLT